MGKPRLLILASTYPASPGDGTPSFVRDLALAMAERLRSGVLAPAVPGGARQRTGRRGRVTRFRYFWKRWEDVAHGAILENVRARPIARSSRCPRLIVAEFLAVRRAVRRRRPDRHPRVLDHSAGPRRASRGPRDPAGGHDPRRRPLRPPFASRMRGEARRAAPGRRRDGHERRDARIGRGARCRCPRPSRRCPWASTSRTFASSRPRACSAGALRLLFVGRLVPKKGLGVLLEALRESPPATPWRSPSCGDGPMLRRPHGRGRRPAGRRSRVRRAARELAGEYAAADVVVFPVHPRRERRPGRPSRRAPRGDGRRVRRRRERPARAERGDRGRRERRPARPPATPAALGACHRGASRPIPR